METFSGCTKLNAVTFSSDNKVFDTLYDQAFYGCTNLSSIWLPECTKSINKQAFYNCTNLNVFSAGDSVTTIGEEAFYNCKNLPYLTLPKTVTNVSKNAFEGCDITEIYYYSSSGTTTEDWCSITFEDANSNPMSQTSGASLYIRVKNASTGQYEYQLVTSATINIKTIRGYCLSNCLSIQSVTIGLDVKNINAYAFYNCDYLKKAVFKDIYDWESEGSQLPYSWLEKAETAATLLRKDESQGGLANHNWVHVQ